MRDHLPPEAVAAGDAVQSDATVDGYKSSRPYHALALEGALAALLGRLLADLGSPAAEASELGRLLAAAQIADSATEISQGMTPGDRAAVRRRAATALGELAGLLRRAAVRAETIELGMTLRAEDLDTDQDTDDRLARKL